MSKNHLESSSSRPEVVRRAPRFLFFNDTAGWGVGWGRGVETGSELEIDLYTLLYLKWINSKDLLSSTGNSAQCYVAAQMGGEFVGEWKHVYVWLSPFAVHLKLS